MIASSQPIRIALAGCGAVGGAVLRAIESGLPLSGRPVEVVKVLVRDSRRHRNFRLPSVTWTTDLKAFLRVPADVVVEAIGGTGPALVIAEQVLGRGGTVVTANKTLIASHGGRLAASARASGGTLAFEAAVGGGVPMVRTIGRALEGQPILGFRGILNGTANFILTRVEAGIDPAAALAEARALGLAEADPSRDLDGRDVADKVAILAWRAWGIDPAALAVRRTGLAGDLVAQVRAAAAAGCRLRLLGSCQRTAAGVVAEVRPEVVPADSPLALTTHEQNRLEIELGWGAPIAVSGPGAGGAPTAAAIWSDLADLAAA